MCEQRNLHSQCPHNPLALGVDGLGERIRITLQGEGKNNLLGLFRIPSEGWLEIYRCLLLLFWKCAIVLWFIFCIADAVPCVKFSDWQLITCH